MVGQDSHIFLVHLEALQKDKRERGHTETQTHRSTGVANFAWGRVRNSINSNQIWAGWYKTL